MQSMHTEATRAELAAQAAGGPDAAYVKVAQAVNACGAEERVPSLDDDP